MANWPRGTRVRCVDASRTGLRLGGEYTVLVVGKALQHPSLVTITGGNLPMTGGNYYAFRFKPIIRVKAPTRKGCCNKACTGCRDWEFRAALHRFATSGDR